MRKRSIGFRLAAWYVLVLACGLALFSIGAWFAMRASIYHAIDDELRDRVRGVTRFMKLQIASLSIPEIRDEFREHSVLGPGGDLFQVCDREGQWLYRSVPLETNNVPIALPDAIDSPRFDTLTVEGRSLRLYSSRINVNGKAYTVQVATPLQETYEALSRFRLLLLSTAPLLLIAATAVGYWLSKRALAPVDEISHRARRISIENLADRLPVSQTGDQLQRLSETLNGTFARLQTAVSRMKEFTADASHELRAPVTLIRTIAEVAVQKDDRAAGEYYDALREILEESERTSQVVDSLMLLARADAGKQELEYSPVDARTVVRDAADQGEKLARKQELKFSVMLPDAPVPIYADANALRRAALILMDNAVKYTPKGGSINVSVGREDGFCMVKVSDTGAGIAESDLPHIFDRFWRADKARSRAQGGAGLGLSIAKWIVEAHRGSIEVSSVVGKGSTFCARLPLTDGSNTAATEASRS